MAYPFTEKEISRWKDAKVQVTSDLKGSLPHFDVNGNKSNIIKIAVPKGEYTVEKVITETYSKNDDGSLGKGTGQKYTYYVFNIPIETDYNVAPLTPYNVYFGAEIKELTTGTEVPIKNTTEPKAETKTSTTIFTTKNVVIGLAFIAAAFGILKWQKVI